MRNQDLVGVNELNAKANGGTELTTRRLFDLLEPEELQGVQIITSRVRELDPDKLRIYHLHDLPHDTEAAHLKQQSSRDRFDKLVFSSHWQYQQFQQVLGLPYSKHSTVIETGVDPFEWKEKSDPRKEPIRLIYTSTPHRGLEILVPVFEHLATLFDFIELDVFSSFQLYGWEQRDAPYQSLFDRCKNHPRIRYHGTVSNATVRAAYEQAHIFAYPSIWPETSCRCLIESMMAGCICVHPNNGALPETSGGLTDIYSADKDHSIHASMFAEYLAQIIHTLRSTDIWDAPAFVQRRKIAHMAATLRFGWPSVVQRWKTLITELKAGV